MQHIASWSADVGHYIKRRLKDFDKMMKKSRLEKICNKILK